jgi:fibronectin type 3 domain-containing protein
MFKYLILFALLVITAVITGCGPTAPDAPTNLSGTAASSQVILNWSAVSDATSYNVYRGTVTGTLSTKTRLVSNLSATTYTDTTIVSTTPYFYQVTAVNADGESGGSHEFSTTSQLLVSPANLTLTNTTQGITLSWSAVQGSTGYRLYRGTTSGTLNKTRIADNLSVTTFQDTTAVTGITYFYQVTSLNSNAESLASADVSVTH